MVWTTWVIWCGRHPKSYGVGDIVWTTKKIYGVDNIDVVHTTYDNLSTLYILFSTGYTHTIYYILWSTTLRVVWRYTVDYFHIWCGDILWTTQYIVWGYSVDYWTYSVEVYCGPLHMWCGDILWSIKKMRSIIYKKNLQTKSRSITTCNLQTKSRSITK